MDTDILILQLRQCGVNVPTDIGQIAFIDTDGLYAILRQVIPLCGLATEAEVKKQFPARLPTTSPSARYYVLNSFDTLLKKKTGGNGGNSKDDDDDDDGDSTCPSTTEHLMYPTEATTRALLSWVVSAVAVRQEKLALAAAADRRTDADEELVGVSPSISRLLKGSLLQLRTKMNDNAAVINAKGGAQNMLLLANPTNTRRRVAASSSSSSAADAAIIPAMIPVAPTFAPTAAEAAASGLNQLNRIAKQGAALYGAPKMQPQRGKLFALAQAFTALHIAKTAAAGKGGKKNAAAVGGASSFEVDESSVYGTAGSGNAKWLLQQQQNSALGALFFDTDADGLDMAGAGGSGAARARTAKKLEEASRDMNEMEEKAKSAAQRLEEREAELQRVQDALSEAKKANKNLKQLLSAAEGEYNASAEELKAFSDALAAKEESLQDRKNLLEQLQTQLGWMEDYDGTVATFEAQIAEAKALQKQVQEDLTQKLAKMEAKKEELNEQVAVAGDGRQEQILAARNKVKKIKREIRAKTKEIEDLHREYDRVPKDIDRSLFLRFIFDMTNNIQRQQAEVDKVKTDLHKESLVITEKSEKLQILFSTVEQEVYKKAVGGSAASGSSSSSKSAAASPDDEFAKDAFKRIVAIREAYANLRAAIQDRGDVRHEVHIMEEKNSKAGRLSAAQDQKKVSADLEAVEEENDELSAKLDKYLESRGDGGNGDDDDDDEDEE